jgi:hypothetical protein
MGLIEILVGVVFTVCVGIGVGVGAMGDAGTVEFSVARAAFVLAALAVAGAFFYWLSEGGKENRAIFFLGLAAGVWVFVGLPFQMKWLEAREAKIKALETAAQSHKESPPETAPKLPDVTLRFVYANEPALMLVNQSDVVAKQIKWTVVLWNMDNPKAYSAGEHSPDPHEPLQIPISVFDFLPARASSIQNLLGSPLVTPHIKKGEKFFGSASVVCPDCERGHTFIVEFELGKGGWFTEILDKTNGDVFIPRRLTKDVVLEYRRELLARIPESARAPIGEPP